MKGHSYVCTALAMSKVFIVLFFFFSWASPLAIYVRSSFSASIWPLHFCFFFRLVGRGREK